MSSGYGQLSGLAGTEADIWTNAHAEDAALVLVQVGDGDGANELHLHVYDGQGNKVGHGQMYTDASSTNDLRALELIVPPGGTLKGEDGGSGSGRPWYAYMVRQWRAVSGS